MGPTAERPALVAASLAGARLAARLAEAWPGAELHVLARYRESAGPRARAVDGPLGPLLAELWPRRARLVIFLPVGAVVRLIAPLLGDKSSDPGVVAVDDGGRFAVCVVGGHAGGGNALAEAVGAVLGAQAVVTTAAEARGRPVPELLGRPFGWRLEAGRAALLAAASALTNGRPLAVYQDGGAEDWRGDDLPIERFASLVELERAAPAAAIVVSDRSLPAAAADWVVWRPRELVAGLGCSSGASAEELAELLEGALAEGGLAQEGVGLLATIDRKLAEPGLAALAGRLGLELRGYPAGELARVAVPNPSDAVRRAVGTASVAEAAALLASGGELLVEKRRGARATVALARRPA